MSSSVAMTRSVFISNLGSFFNPAGTLISILILNVLGLKLECLVSSSSAAMSQGFFHQFQSYISLSQSFVVA